MVRLYTDSKKHRRIQHDASHPMGAPHDRKCCDRDRAVCRARMNRGKGKNIEQSHKCHTPNSTRPTRSALIPTSRVSRLSARNSDGLERVARGVSDRARTERQYENRQGIGPRSAVAPRSLAVWMQGMRDRGPLNDRERRRSQRGNTVSLRFIPAGVKLFSAPGAVEVRTR